MSSSSSQLGTIKEGSEPSLTHEMRMVLSPTPMRTEELQAALAEACAALRGQKNCEADAAIIPAIAPPIKAARDEVARLGQLSVALQSELELLENEVACARHSQASGQQACVEDATLYRDQLEAVTAALVAQGSELQEARGRVRRLEGTRPGAGDEMGGVSEEGVAKQKQEEMEDLLARIAAQQLERQRRTAEADERQLRRRHALETALRAEQQRALALGTLVERCGGYKPNPTP